MIILKITSCKIDATIKIISWDATFKITSCKIEATFKITSCKIEATLNDYITVYDYNYCMCNFYLA